MIEYVVFVSLGYLLGSVPFGLIAGRIFGGVDIREHGSGNTGMTNVLRTINPPVAILVLGLDMSKAASVVLLAKSTGGAPMVETLAAVAAVVGHNWSVFVRFSGGKGTAPGWGGLLALSPIAGIVATVVGIVTVALTRYVSLGSLLAATVGSAALAALALAGIEPLSYALYGTAAPIILFKHRDNIKRIVKGEERKFGQRADTVPTQTGSRRGKGLRWPRSA